MRNDLTWALVAGWLCGVAPRTTGYLDPYLGRALDQFAGMAGEGGGGRTLFRGSVAPWWERAAAFAAPVVAFAAMLAAAHRLRGADLLGATLGEADLTQAHLGYANLRGTDLSARDLTPSGLTVIAHVAKSARPWSRPA